MAESPQAADIRSNTPPLPHFTYINDDTAKTDPGFKSFGYRTCKKNN